MGLLSKIKNDVKNSGGSKSKFMYWRDGDKHRIRFLTDMDDGMDVEFHDSFEQNLNVPCQKLFGRDCPYCEMEGLRTRSQYIWSVWDYEAKEVKLYMSPVNNFTAIPALMAMYENYGTLTDRDYVISQTGKSTNKSFSVIPMDKNKFRNSKAKPLAKQEILKLLDKAWPADIEEDDTFNVEESEYQEMKPSELYKLCIEREIEAEPRKPKNYYVNLLEEYDQAQDDWDDDSEDDDDWDEMEDDWDELEEEFSDNNDKKEELIKQYESNSVVELYKLAKQSGLDVKPRQDKETYINILVEAELSEDEEEWDDEEWD